MGNEVVERRALRRWRTAVAVWLLAWVLLIASVLALGFGGFFVAPLAYALGRHGGPQDWTGRRT